MVASDGLLAFYRLLEFVREIAGNDYYRHGADRADVQVAAAEVLAAIGYPLDEVDAG